MSVTPILDPSLVSDLRTAVAGDVVTPDDDERDRPVGARGA
jgi:hypothetical protein